MNQSDKASGVGRLGDLLKTARQRKGMTLKDVADDPLVGVSAAFLSRVERNDALPSDELLLKLARRLDLDPSDALMHLFRERSSPEARALLPLPAVLKLDAGTGRTQRFEGLEAIAEPLSQVLDLHRGVLAANARLREEVATLSDEVQEQRSALTASKRGFLPDVNRFLISLFNYESEIVRRDAVVDHNGDATITVTLEGIAPNRGAKPIRSLAHSVFIPQAVDGSLNIPGQAMGFQILDKPAGLEVDWTFKRQSPERGALLVTFPDGYSHSPRSPKLSYQFSYRLEKAFVMTLEEAKATYGKRSVHDLPLEWSSCFINKPVKRLEISVTLPEGYAPSYVDKWVWWTETSFLECDYNLADQLLADEEDGIEIDAALERTTVRLRARNPLLGFSYGIVWQPLAKRQYLNLPRR